MRLNFRAFLLHTGSSHRHFLQLLSCVQVCAAVGMEIPMCRPSVWVVACLATLLPQEQSCILYLVQEHVTRVHKVCCAMRSPSVAHVLLVHRCSSSVAALSVRAGAWTLHISTVISFVYCIYRFTSQLVGRRPAYPASEAVYYTAFLGLLFRGPEAIRLSQPQHFVQRCGCISTSTVRMVACGLDVNWDRLATGCGHRSCMPSVQ